MKYILVEYMVDNNGKKKPDFYFGGYSEKYADMIYIATKDTAYAFDDKGKAEKTAILLKRGGYEFQVEEQAAG